MLQVSDAWKEVHKNPFLPESFVEISFSVFDAGAAGTVSSNNEATFSNSASIVHNQNVKTRSYAFLEHNLWVLDGSRSIYGASAPPGYVSENDEDAVLTIALTNTPKEIPGFTITWSSEYDSYATNFTLEAKSGDTVVGSVTVNDNTSNVTEVDLLVSSYDSVVLTILGWSLPEQRRRVDSILFGRKVIFGKDEILEYSHEQSGDPLGTELTRNVIEFSLDNTDGRWNLLNPDSMTRFLKKKQEITVRYGLTVNSVVEWINAGTFYLTEWKDGADGISITFSARDFIELLTSTQYTRLKPEGLTTKNPTTIYAKEPAEVITTVSAGRYFDILGASFVDLYGEPTENPNEASYTRYFVYFENENISGYIKESDMSFVTTLYSDMRDALWSGISVPLTYFTSLKEIPPPMQLENVVVSEFLQECLGSYGITMWFNGSSGRVMLTQPDKTLSDYVISGELAYTRPELELSKPLKKLCVTLRNRISPTHEEEYWMDVGTEGDNIILSTQYLWNPSSHISGVRNRYKNWWGNREKFSGEFRPDPRLTLFDVVTVETKYGKVSPIMITYLKYTYNGSFRATYEGKLCGAIKVETTEV